MEQLQLLLNKIHDRAYICIADTHMQTCTQHLLWQL